MLRSATASRGAAILLIALGLAGCRALDDPEADQDELSEVQEVVSERRIASVAADAPRRRALEFIREVQLRNWSEAYNRFATRRVRRAYTFDRFIRVSKLQEDRLKLPFRIGGSRVEGSRATVRVTISNPIDDTTTYDSYILRRVNGRWLVSFASWLEDQDLTLRLIDGEARR